MSSRESLRSPHILYDATRLETLADGVFAVVVTLLVLDIRIPEGFEASVGTWLLANWQLFLSYFLSFWLTSLYWMNHHETFHHIQRVDQPMLRWNFVFLFFVALLPFSSTLISQHGNDSASPIFYSLNLFLIGISLYFVRWHAINTPSLGDDDDRSDQYLQRLMLIRILAPSLVYMFVILISLLGYPANSYFAFVLIPFVQRLFQHYFTKPLLSSASTSNKATKSTNSQTNKSS